MKNKIKILIVDDHEIVRDGIKALLLLSPDIKIIAGAGDGKTLFEILNSKTPHIVLLDIGLPDISGIEISRILKKRYPEIKIIILTAELSEKNIIDSIEAGVNGFLPKNAGKDKLIDAIRTVYEGEEYFDASISKTVLNHLLRLRTFSVKRQKPVELTSRETEIVKNIVDGLTHKEIAAKLYISKRTVDTHVRNIMEKFDFRSKADIIKYAIKTGLVEL